MPDRISQYRQFRLTLNPDRLSPTLSWSLASIQVRKGIPYTEMWDHGRLTDHPMPASPEECITSLEDVVAALSLRWRLT